MQEQTTIRKRSHLFSIFLLLIFFGVVVLTLIVKANPTYFSLDLFVTRGVQNINNPLFDNLMNFLTDLGNFTEYLISVLIFLGIFFYLGKYKDGGLLLLSVAGANLLGLIVKAFVERVRPDPNLIHQVGSFLKHDSFPSGHVLSFMGLYGFLLFLIFSTFSKGLMRTFLIVFLSAVLLLIGVSRIYLGAHWFSDVLGSYLYGILWLYIISLTYHRLTF